jgi:secondary thiamine-phosphate synthase enzyme
MESYPITLELTTQRRTEWVELTDRIQTALGETDCHRGSALVYVPHTTAGITINENADPDVAADMMRFLDGLVPHRADYAHAEGNSDAHIKASLMGSAVRVPVENGRLCLGR